MASSGRPVMPPTVSCSSAVPPCASMTRFAVSTTKRTLSVSVPSRSQRTARTVTLAPLAMPGAGSASAAAARRGDDRGLDRQRRLLRELAVARLLSEANERLELVVEGVGVLQTRIDDLESQIAHRIRFSEAFEDHLADPLRS